MSVTRENQALSRELSELIMNQGRYIQELSTTVNALKRLDETVITLSHNINQINLNLAKSEGMDIPTRIRDLEKKVEENKKFRYIALGAIIVLEPIVILALNWAFKFI